MSQNLQVFVPAVHYPILTSVQLGEAEFWERYFSSKLFDRHRASSRNSVAKSDPIFDKYLEKEDDGSFNNLGSKALSFMHPKIPSHSILEMNECHYSWIWRQRRRIMAKSDPLSFQIVN